jgi:hypothetical protein
MLELDHSGGGDMAGLPTDHAELVTLPFSTCLRLLASAPVGRVGIHAEGEILILPVNHAVDGQDVVFRTVTGSKLSAAEEQEQVAFEADGYDPQTRTGWSVLVTGRAEIVYDDADIDRLNGLGLRPWPAGAERPFWIRIRPTSVTGRQIL